MNEGQHLHYESGKIHARSEIASPRELERKEPLVMMINENEVKEEEDSESFQLIEET